MRLCNTANAAQEVEAKVGVRVLVVSTMAMKSHSAGIMESLKKD